MAEVKFKRKSTSEIENLSVDDGSFIVDYETGNAYIDYQNERVQVSGGASSGGETLPVGTEVEFDGTSQDIPVGWEQVNDRIKILWTNPNPTSTFPAQTITLNSNDYDILEIFFQQSNSDTRQTSSSRMLKGVNGRLIASYSGNLTTRNIDRNSDISYSFSESSATGYETTSLIPVYIVGYKTGLFN